MSHPSEWFRTFPPLPSRCAPRARVRSRRKPAQRRSGGLATRVARSAVEN